MNKMTDNLPVPKQESYQLAKALFNITNASHYLEGMIGMSVLKTEAKNRLRMWRSKIEWVKTDIYSKMTPDTAAILKRELETYESIAIDSCTDELMKMNEDGRLLAEKILKAINAGEITNYQSKQTV